jgi:hypothetical protein
VKYHFVVCMCTYISNVQKSSIKKK